MLKQLRTAVSALASISALALSLAPARAQVEDEEALDRKVRAELEENEEDEVSYGAGIRLRYIFVPKGMIELFVDEASSGVSSTGFGLDFIRRKGDFELQVGVEYEDVSPDNGYWLEKGDSGTSPGEYPDFVTFDGLSWATLDATFIFHSELHETFSLRYGAGFGLGLVLGDVIQDDQICTSRDFEQDCTLNTAGEVNEKADVPPVFPVVNVLAGAQFRPIEKVAINLEVGMRTVFFAGISSAYFF